MILHISLFAKLNHNGWMNFKTCPMWFALFRIVSLDEWMESYVISVNSQVNTKALDSGNHGKYSTHIKYFSLLAAALFWSIWPHEICLCNQNHIKPMSVIWSLKLFSQKINIESMISHDIDLDSASKSSNELNKSYFLCISFSVQQLPTITYASDQMCKVWAHHDALIAIICSYMFSCSKSNKCGCCVNRFLQNQLSYEPSLCHSLSDQIEVLFRLVCTYICLKP